MTGAAASGSPLGARMVAVVGPVGAVVVLGITTPDKIALLGRRVDARALSVRLFKP